MTSTKPKALLDEITELGRCAMRNRNPATDEAKKEFNLAMRLAKARTEGWLFPAHEAAIQLLRADISSSEALLEEIKKFGRVPMRQTKAATAKKKKKTI